jgi:catechol 2,3-dioxygenase-like lactoylglutathione lyase family enzyme
VGILGVNHIAFRTPDVERLRSFYAELLEADVLDGEHGPLRAGATLLAFFPSEDNPISNDPDELAFDADAQGFDDAVARARALGALVREPVEHSPWSRGFVIRDPDGRRVEIAHDDRGVYWQA